MASAKEYLKQIRTEQIEANILRDRQETLRMSLYPKAITYDGDKIQSSPSDVFSEKMVKICELEKEVERHIKKLDKRKADAMRTTEKIEDSVSRQLIALYYLSTQKGGALLRWADVAKLMNYSQDHVIKVLHPKALRDFSDKMKMP